MKLTLNSRPGYLLLDAQTIEDPPYGLPSAILPIAHDKCGEFQNLTWIDLNEDPHAHVVYMVESVHSSWCNRYNGKYELDATYSEADNPGKSVSISLRMEDSVLKIVRSENDPYLEYGHSWIRSETYTCNFK